MWFIWTLAAIGGLALVLLLLGYLASKTWPCLLFLLLPFSAHAAVVPPSGGDDTAAIQKVCNAGDAVQLVTGTYNVSSVSCARIVGFGAGGYFYYEGQVEPIIINGMTGPRGAIVCPAPGPCAYMGFAVHPAPGSAGLVIDGVHDVRLTNVSITDVAGGNSGSCIDANTSGLNQALVIQGGTFQHCGGWCVESSNLSDSTFIGGTYSNCQQGDIHIALGDGNRVIGNYIEDTYTVPGLRVDNGGAWLISSNSFDSNGQDMVLGLGGQFWGSITGNVSCRNAGGGMFDIEGPSYITASGNVACAPEYVVGPAGSVTGGAFYDPAPSYNPGDQNSQNIIGPFIR